MSPTAAITIVIPVWGAYAWAHAPRAIESIRAQGVPAAIVLIDNADDAEIDWPGVEIVRSSERLSLGAARNAGLRHAVTPFVMFWDADDVMLDGMLSRVIERLERDPAAIACGTTIVDAAVGRPHHWPRHWPLRLRRLPALFAAVNAVSSLYPSIGVAIRTEVASDTAFPSVDSGDDWVMAVSLAFRGRIAVDRRPGRLYGRHPGSVSAAWDRVDALRHAALVRERLRSDAGVPGYVRSLLPLIWLGQQIVIRVLSSLARRLRSVTAEAAASTDARGWTGGLDRRTETQAGIDV